MFPIVAEQIYFPTSNTQGLQFSYIFVNTSAATKNHYYSHLITA